MSCDEGENLSLKLYYKSLLLKSYSLKSETDYLEAYLRIIILLSTLLSTVVQL